MIVGERRWRSQQQAAAPPAQYVRSGWIAVDSSIGRSTTQQTAATIRGAAAELLRNTAIA